VDHCRGGLTSPDHSSAFRVAGSTFIGPTLRDRMEATLPIAILPMLILCDSLHSEIGAGVLELCDSLHSEIGVGVLELCDSLHSEIGVGMLDLRDSLHSKIGSD